MSRPSEISTKTISVRIPMEDYVHFLQEAMKAKLSMSEYLTLRIYHDDRVKELEEQIKLKTKEFEKKLSDKDKELKTVSEKLNTSLLEKKKVENDISTLSVKVKALDSEKIQLSSKTIASSSEATKLKAEIAILTKKVSDLSTNIATLQKEKQKALDEKAQILAKNTAIFSELEAINNDAFGGLGNKTKIAVNKLDRNNK